MPPAASRFLVFGLAAALGASPAAAADLLAIRAGRLIDGTGAAPARDVVILVEGTRIKAVGPGLAVPPGARVLDLSGQTVLPGFIDAHVHLIGRGIGEGPNWEDAATRDLPALGAIYGVRNAGLTLEAGFTTVRNVGAADFADIALRDAIRSGVVPGPRIVAAGHSIGITGGHCDDNGFAPGILEPVLGRGIADGPAEILKEVRYQVKHGADVIKFCATGGVLSEGDAVGIQQYTAEEMKVLVDEAHLTGRRVAAHAHGNAGIKAAIAAGVDSIEHGSEIDDETIALFRKHGTWLVPTLMAQESVEARSRSGVLTGQRAEKALSIAPRARASFRKAAGAGVKIALGSDAGVFAHGTQGREFVLMVEHGLSPMQAIQAGTRGAADLLGLAAELGTVEAGRIADLVAVSGDPLADIQVLTHPVFVLHEGRVARDDTAVGAPGR